MPSSDPIKHRDDPELRASANMFAGQRGIGSHKTGAKRALLPSRSGFWAFRHSALTRRMVILNLIALNILIAAVLYFSSARDSLVFQRSQAMVVEAELAANIITLQMAQNTGPQCTRFFYERRGAYQISQTQTRKQRF